MIQYGDEVKELLSISVEPADVKKTNLDGVLLPVLLLLPVLEAEEGDLPVIDYLDIPLHLISCDQAALVVKGDESLIIRPVDLANQHRRI